MNSYRVWYSFTEPSCECPEVLVIGEVLYIDTIAKSHKAAKDYINNNSYLNSVKENFKVLISKLIEKDVHKLKEDEVKGVKRKLGLGASFLVEGEEVAVIARTSFQLQAIAVTIFGHSFVIDEDKLKPVYIAAQEV